MGNERAIRFTGLSLLLLLACGGSEAKLPDPGRPFTEDEVYPPSDGAPSDAVLVDAIDWRSEHIEFWNTRPGDDTPGILTVQVGEMDEGEILTRLQAETDVTVTPAELWRAVTGRQDVPEALALSHARTVEIEGRPLAYQDFDMTTEDKTTFVFNSMFPSQINQCWGSSHTFIAATGLIVGVLDSYVCSSDNPAAVPGAQFVHFSQVNLSSACTASSASTATLRVGVYKDHSQFAPQVGQICYDNGRASPSWACQNTFTVCKSCYAASNFVADGFAKKMAIGLHENDEPTLFPANNVLVYGAAKLLSGPSRSATDSRCR